MGVRKNSSQAITIIILIKSRFNQNNNIFYIYKRTQSTTQKRILGCVILRSDDKSAQSFSSLNQEITSKSLIEAFRSDIAITKILFLQ